MVEAVDLALRRTTDDDHDGGGDTEGLSESNSSACLLPQSTLHAGRKTWSLRRRYWFYESEDSPLYYAVGLYKLLTALEIFNASNEKIGWIVQKPTFIPAYEIWFDNKQIALLRSCNKLKQAVYELSLLKPDGSTDLYWIIKRNKKKKNLRISNPTGASQGRIIRRRFSPKKCYTAVVVQDADMKLTVATVLCIEMIRLQQRSVAGGS
eukprot:Protomagalhaensia_wolfi_Nauph_80__5431@NODE_592_length_2236_cov_43_613564_g443_i0_p1_GENE_NODE_592_length_2236_cov_43_613564_g443_i0NODE_592_length_2236_cov_43_613564_g443_i0_p1_ORF_typecomplete_len208_score21_58_NODE_592_length_2236_cov_43_613564_g443_i07101333